MSEDLCQSFEKRKNECLDACREWFKTPHNPLEDLKYPIKNPTQAWFRHRARWKMYKLSEWIKLKLFQADNNLFSDMRYRPIVEWLNSFFDYPQGERCSVSPQVLRAAGFKEGDELWYWSTPDHTWKFMFGSAGYAIVRAGVIVWSYVTETN